jgi:hypothetical protein
MRASRAGSYPTWQACARSRLNLGAFQCPRAAYDGSTMIIADALSLQALLPGAAALLASAMAIHSLIQQAMTYGRKLLCGIYVLLTVLITLGLVFFGARRSTCSREQTAYSNELNDKLDRLRALMGNNPSLTGPQVLQGMIEQFSKPYELSDPQYLDWQMSFSLLKVNCLTRS